MLLSEVVLLFFNKLEDVNLLLVGDRLTILVLEMLVGHGEMFCCCD